MKDVRKKLLVWTIISTVAGLINLFLIYILSGSQLRPGGSEDYFYLLILFIPFLIFPSIFYWIIESWQKKSFTRKWLMTLMLLLSADFGFTPPIGGGETSFLILTGIPFALLCSVILVPIAALIGYILDWAIGFLIIKLSNKNEQ